MVYKVIEGCFPKAEIVEGLLALSAIYEEERENLRLMVYFTEGTDGTFRVEKITEFKLPTDQRQAEETAQRYLAIEVEEDGLDQPTMYCELNEVDEEGEYVDTLEDELFDVSLFPNGMKL